jgi:predicted  nucleic acid-binding Zn-ribbon protein
VAAFTCRDCGTVFERESAHGPIRRRCPACAQARNRQRRNPENARKHRAKWLEKNPETQRQAQARWTRQHSARLRDRWSDARVLRTYGLTPEAYRQLLESQGGACAICRKACATGRRLAVDHDHGTGEIRGLLCAMCNRHLPIVETLAREALEYLANPPARAVLRKET